MKRIKQLLILLLLALPLLSLEADETYRYPVNPGSQEWKEMKSHKERLKVCQISPAQLKKMSTHTLAEDCMRYPFNCEILAYNTLEDGVKYVTAQFNGYTELLRRKDGAQQLLKLYEEIDPAKFPVDGSLVQKGKYTLKLIYIELLLAHRNFLEQLGTTGRCRLLAQSISKLETKINFPDIYGLVSLNTPVLAMGRIIEMDSPQSFSDKLRKEGNLKGFLTAARIVEPQLLNEILMKARKYLSDK